MGALKLYTSDVITKQDSFWFWFDWSEPTPGEVRDAAATLDAIRNSAGNFDSIELTIVNCPGGSAYEARSMYDLLKSQGVPVTTRAVGMCASAATILFAAGDDGKRVSTPNCQWLIHEARFDFIDGGTADSLEKDAAELRRTNEWAAERYAEASGGKKTKDEWLAVMKEDRFTSAQIMQEFGLVSKIDQYVPLNSADVSQRFSIIKMAQTPEKSSWLSKFLQNMGMTADGQAAVETTDTVETPAPTETPEANTETAPTEAAEIAELRQANEALQAQMSKGFDEIRQALETMQNAMTMQVKQKENNAARVANLAQMSRQANPEQTQTVRNTEPRKLSIADLTSNR